MKTLIWIFSTLILIATSAYSQITFNGQFPRPAIPTVNLNTNATIVSVCPDTTNHSVLLVGNGSNFGEIEIILPSSINDISMDASTNQPGKSGKIEIQGYDQNGNSVANATNYTITNASGCPSFFIQHNFSTPVWKVRISKHAGSASDLLVDNISSASPLPVELVSFSGYIYSNRIGLMWKTATEINNYGFEVQRKIDLNDWSVVGFVMGHGTSDSYKSYSFSDVMNINFSEIRYRLRQIDRGGTFTYSNELVFSSSQPIVNDLAIYPNPSEPNKTATVSFSLTVPKYVSIDLYDMQGKRIKVVVDHEYLSEGIHFRSVKMSDLSVGTYTVRLRYDGFSHSGRMLIR